MKQTRTDEQWDQLLKQRVARLSKFVELKAPKIVIIMETRLVYQALFKESKWLMFRSFVHRSRVSILLNILMFWRLRILRLNPEDDSTWQ